MKSPQRSFGLLALIALAVTLLAGCEGQPVAPNTTDVDPQFGKQPSGPAYLQLTLDAVPGQQSAIATGINDSHQVVGTIQYGNRTGTAFFWSEASPGLQPQLLPDLPGVPESVANDINAAGDVAGAAGSEVYGGFIGDPVPVIWQQSGSGWTLRRLEGPGVALGLNDLGEVVGFRKTDPAQMNEEPIFWDAAGVATQLPMPEGARQAHANHINKDGDVAGQATFPSGQIVAVLWVRGGVAQWAPVLLNGAEVLGLTDRRGDGTLLLSGIDGNPGCCQPFRWTVKIIDAAAGDVQTVREALGTDLFNAGSGSAINAAGDVAGYGRKGNTRSTPQPALFPISGSTVSLPAGKSTYTGRVNGISLDRWMAGFVEGKAVVWYPSR